MDLTRLGPLPLQIMEAIDKETAISLATIKTPVRLSLEEDFNKTCHSALVLAGTALKLGFEGTQGVEGLAAGQPWVMLSRNNRGISIGPEATICSSFLFSGTWVHLKGKMGPASSKPFQVDFQQSYISCLSPSQLVVRKTAEASILNWTRSDESERADS